MREGEAAPRRAGGGVSRSDVRRVALVIGQLHAGGSERQVVELAPRLLGGRCAPFVYCLTQATEPFGPKLAAAGVPLRVLPRRRSYEPRRVLRLARLLREDRIDIVYSLSINTNLYALLALRLSPRRPLVTSNRALDPTCGRLTGGVNRFVFRHSDRVVVNSEAGRLFTSRFYRVPPDRIDVIPNGVDVNRFSSPADAAATRAAVGLPMNAPVAGFIGRASAEKRLELFLEVARVVASRFPETHFLVVGDGPLLSEMKKRALETGIGHKTVFTGSRDDVPALLAAMDLLVLTSSQEGLPNAVLEAMAAGRPVVATDVGGCRELIVEGITGFLADPEGPQELTEKVLRVLSSPDRGRALGEAGRRRARSEFSVETMTRRFEELFLRLLRNDHPPDP